MIRTSWLDDLIQRFQHRWETNPQYRAAMSGVLGLIFLISMCTCVGLVTTGANVALASLGFGTGSNDQGSNNNTGTKEVKGFATFPVTTYVPQTPNAIPEGTVPNSGTPMPTATPPPTPTNTPTPTPCTTNCGGGGGNNCSTCTVDDSIAPDPLVAGQNATVSFHTGQPNIQMYVIADVPGCVTQLSNPATTITDASGNGSWTFKVCGGANHGSRANITVSGGFSIGQVFGPTLKPQVA